MNPEGHFRYKSLSEQEEKLDYDHPKPCPNCQKSIAQDATICYFCGQDVGCQSKTSWVGWIVAFLIIVFILALLFNL